MRLLVAAVLVALMASTTLAAAAPLRGSMEELVAVDRLPFLHPPGTRTHQFASFSRDESNNDGFSGQYSYLRYVMDHGQPASLIADFDRPGCIYRFWATAVPEGRIKFYFDGSDTPEIDIPFREMFQSRHYPFLAPVAGQGLGGFYSYVPIAWKKSCRIVVTSREMRFYQITYLTFPDDKNVRTFKLKDWERNRGRFEEIRKLWSDLGQRPTAPGKDEQTVEQNGTLNADGVLELAELRGPGTVRELRIRMDPRSDDARRAVRLRVLYDGSDQPAVDCPIGDFFGDGLEDHPWASLLLGQRDGEYFCYFPMPFQKNARIQLIYDQYLSQRTQPEVKIEARIAWEPMKKWTGEQGSFHAQWRRQNPTDDRVNYTFLRAHGRGHLVGTIQYCDTPLDLNVPLYFEGDEVTYADGRLALHGTGSEDFYNMGWYALPQGFSRPGDFPLHGGLKYSNRSVAAYRFQMTDPVVFEHSLDHGMQHGGVNEIQADYASVAYWYQQLPADPVHVQPVRERLIAWLRPGGSLEAEDALARRDVVQLLSEYDEPSAMHWSYGRAARVQLEAGRPVSLDVAAPHAGGFELYASVVKTPDSPTMLHAHTGRASLGDSEPLRSDARAYAEKVLLARGPLASGQQRILLMPESGKELVLDRLWLEPLDWTRRFRPATPTREEGGCIVYDLDFNRPATLQLFAPTSGDWEVVDGVLSPVSGNGGVVWLRRSFKGDVRVQARVRGPQDLNLVLMGDGQEVGRGRGYVFTYGGQRNRVSAIASDWRRPLVRADEAITDPRAFHDVVGEKKGNLLTLTVDGKQLLRHELSSDERQDEGYVGLFTTSGDTAFDRLTIEGQK